MLGGDEVEERAPAWAFVSFVTGMEERGRRRTGRRCQVRVIADDRDDVDGQALGLLAAGGRSGSGLRATPMMVRSYGPGRRRGR